MECLATFGLLVGGIVVLITFALKAQSRADRWNRSYQTLAQRYGGACLPAGWFGRPSVRFRYGPTQVLVNTVATGQSGQYTQIHINWPDPDLRLEIHPNWGVTVRTPRGLMPIQVGSEYFDHKFAVLGSDEAEARAFLNDGVRWQIDRLRHFLDNGDLFVGVSRGRMLIKKQSLIQRFADLDEFVQLGLGLFDQAMLSKSVGIEFVEDVSLQLIDDARCQICGDDITTDMVFCRRCKTPHHLECWEYYGACSVYGCQETKYVTPRLAGPADP